MSNVSKVKATVIVTRDEMAYMVQRVVANMEEKMLSQIFYDKALEGVKKEVGNIDENGIVNTNRFISIPITVVVEKEETEAEITSVDITSVLASRIYDSITEAYKVASVLVATDTYESITGVNSEGKLVTITKEKNGNQSFETSITASL